MSLVAYPPATATATVDVGHAKSTNMSLRITSSPSVPPTTTKASSPTGLKVTVPAQSQPTNLHQHASASRSYMSPQATDREPYERHPLLDDLYTMDVAGVVPSLKRVSTAPSPTKPPALPAGSRPLAPALPERSALRASRLLDNMGLKLGGSMEAANLSQTTPLDVYMSSEEDASSSADDFSDDDLDMSSQGSGSASSPRSPPRRSREDTARVVSVVFSGKPSIVNLSTARRVSMPPASKQPRANRSCTPVLSEIRTHDLPPDRYESPASSVSSFSQRPPGPPVRSGTTMSDQVTSMRPPLFLSIDPYANGSRYSLEPPSAEDSPMKPPRTPTQQLMKGVSRTIGLVRKKSRPFLGGSPRASREGSISATTPNSRYSSLGASSRLSLAIPADEDELPTYSAPAKLTRRATSGILEPTSGHCLADPFLKLQTTPESRASSVSSTPVTYGDIIRSVKRNAKLTISPLSLPPAGLHSQQQASDLHSPAPSPTLADGGHKRGILRGLNARRRSMKPTAKLN